MDEIMRRASRGRRVGVPPSPEVLEGRRLMAANPAQVGFGEYADNGSTDLVITGHEGADVINVADNGTGAAGNITVTLGDGSTYTSQGAISTIEVLAKGGNDQVNYNLTGTLSRSGRY